MTARIRLHYLDGRPDSTETHLLGLAVRDGRLCIDSDALAKNR